MSKTVKMLDCTFRDGGYYNNWDFDNKVTKTYLSCMSDCGIDFVEIGFRSMPQDSYAGPFLYSTDHYLESICIPDNLSVGVMINASEYFDLNEEAFDELSNLFQKCSDSPVDLVRIAVNFNNFELAKDITTFIKDLGYLVGFNLMQAHGKEYLAYKNTAKEIQNWGVVDILYFADSLGSMSPEEVKFICNGLLEGWSGDIGFHSHNNKGLALSNALTALSSGVNFCDSTILGMGRGAGNVSTESLLMEANSLGIHKGNSRMLTGTLKDFSELKVHYNWGANPYYHFAANNGIHPTYVQSLLSDKRYEDEDLFFILENISRTKSSSFNEKNLFEAIYTNFDDFKDGEWDATDWVLGREILLLGSGPSLEKHKLAIENYIQNQKPFVVSLNVNRVIDNDLIDTVIISHPQRVLLDCKDLVSVNCPIVMPRSRIKMEMGHSFNDLQILDYGLSIKEDLVSIRSNGCTLSSPLALTYALCVCTKGGASRMKIVGFDGYNIDDPRQTRVNLAFNQYRELPNSVTIEALTPTSYPIKQGSIYAPDVIKKDFVLIIPARFQSTRFPGKPLADLCGKSVLFRVWEKCIKAVGENNVIVATDDQRIIDHCNEFRMSAMITSSDCLTGTDRLAEVAAKINRSFYINVQGDEPLVNYEDILKIIKVTRSNPGVIINGMCEIDSEEDYQSVNVPKVVCDENSNLLYMSRSPIPGNKEQKLSTSMRQVCIYSFPKNALLKFGKINRKSVNEKEEDIEILRLLDLGYKIRMVRVSPTPVAIDTPKDLCKARALIESKPKKYLS